MIVSALNTTGDRNGISIKKTAYSDTGKVLDKGVQVDENYRIEIEKVKENQ